MKRLQYLPTELIHYLSAHFLSINDFIIFRATSKCFYCPLHCYADKALLSNLAILKNLPVLYKSLLSLLKFDPFTNANEALCWCVQFNHIQILDSLLERPNCDPKFSLKLLANLAAQFGHTRILKRLFEHQKKFVDSKLLEVTIKTAVQFGHVDILNFCLQSSPNIVSENFVSLSIKKANFEVTKLLLSFNQNLTSHLLSHDYTTSRHLLAYTNFNPLHNSTSCLTIAVIEGKLDVILLLLCDERIQKHNRVFMIGLAVSWGFKGRILKVLAQGVDDLEVGVYFLFTCLEKEFMIDRPDEWEDSRCVPRCYLESFLDGWSELFFEVLERLVKRGCLDSVAELNGYKLLDGFRKKIGGMFSVVVMEREMLEITEIFKKNIHE